MTAPPASWALAASALRGRQWAHFLLLPVAALDGDALREPIVAALRLAHGAAIAALALAYAYGLNAITDRGADRSPAKNPLAGSVRSPPEALLLVAGAAIGGLVAALLAGPLPLGATLVSLLASTLYSAGPRWKALPFVGTLVNGAIFAPLLVVAPGSTWGRELPLLGLALLALLLQNQLLHELADGDEDRQAGVRTTALRIGERGVRALTVGLAVAAIAAVVGLGGRGRGALLALILLPPTVVALLARPAPALRRRLHRYLALVAGGALFLLLRAGVEP